MALSVQCVVCLITNRGIFVEGVLRSSLEDKQEVEVPHPHHCTLLDVALESYFVGRRATRSRRDTNFSFEQATEPEGHEAELRGGEAQKQTSLTEGTAATQKPHTYISLTLPHGNAILNFDEVPISLGGG